MGQTPRESRQGLIEAALPGLSTRRQCQLLGINRSSLYYASKALDLSDLDLLNQVRAVWMRYPFYGYRRITRELNSQGIIVNRKRIQRIMRLGGIQAIYPGPNTSRRNKQNAIHPYLLKDLRIHKPNQVWMVDITYLRTPKGFMYLVALIDVYSRYIVSWFLSNTLETSNCMEALKIGLLQATPAIINSDQGAQFTSSEWVDFLRGNNIRISMTGKGRCLDNIYIERFWRSLKQEECYLHEYKSIKALREAIDAYIEFYNHKRWHQSLSYKTPASVYFSEAGTKELVDMCTSPSGQPIPVGSCG